MLRYRMGKRIVKTAAAVFLTAQICQWLGWPSIFAVIAAIVTIEPTVHDSIRKGVIRLPSAAIGALFAMTFQAWLGQQPLTYALSALATIYVCQLLRWNDSLVVATLTSVNMITLIDAHFLTNFFVRLGTTSTGIIVSALINYLVFPPRYDRVIRERIPGHIQTTLCLAHRAVKRSLTTDDEAGAATLLHQIMKVQREIMLTVKLISFQKVDHRYHRASYTNMKQLLEMKHTLNLLQQITHYVEGLLEYPSYRAAKETRDWLWQEWKQEFPRSSRSEEDSPRRLAMQWPNMDSHELYTICQIEALLTVIHKLPAEYVDPEAIQSHLAAQSSSCGRRQNVVADNTMTLKQ